jgi:hypothetical protein
MKKTLFVLLLLVSVSATHAQWSITPEAGFTTVKRTGASDWKPGAKIGLGVEYDFSNRFALQSGLYYASQGYSANGPTILYSPENGGQYFEDDRDQPSKQNRNFLQLPVMAKFSWGVSEDARISFAAGPYVALGSEPRLAYWNTGLPHPSDENHVRKSPDYHDLSWGASIALGVEVKQLAVKLGYDISLRPEGPEDYQDANYHTFSLTVGYKFKLGK